MGFERSYPIKVLSNQINRYSTIRFLPNKSTLTLFKLKLAYLFVIWVPYIHILLSICYICFNLFIILVSIYLDGHLNNMSIDFYYNYSVAFDSDTDNTVYSSGGNNNFYDPVRDSYRPTNIERENHPTEGTFAARDRTDTDKLAGFLSKHTYDEIYSTGIRFLRTSNLPEDIQYYSKVTYCVREEYPDMFRRSSGSTRLTPEFINFIKNLDKNYDLRNTGMY